LGRSPQAAHFNADAQHTQVGHTDARVVGFFRPGALGRRGGQFDRVDARHGHLVARSYPIGQVPRSYL